MPKSRTNKFIDTIDECLTNGVKNGIFQVSLEDDALNGRQVTIDGKTVINFGSCSYLGLEVDERLKQGAIDATVKFGTQYSSSRLFSACNLYEEIEGLFEQIFGHPSILAATTTLTHLGALPILVQDEDLVILDHQVHGSVQLAVQVVKARGTKVEMIKHSNMSMLEDLIKENPNKYNKIWYMADGLYSMYGDFAPLNEIVYLLNKYGNFYAYFDDAHGMSWAGKHGAGYVMSQTPLHPKMVLTTSLAKGFGTGGGVTVIQDKEMRRKILTCGSSYTFSGPIQPPMLGASIASAKIHLSDDIYKLQNQLQERLQLATDLISQYKLPHVLPSRSPIFYLGLGLPRVGYNMVKRLLSEGYYTNIGIFPGVPVKCCGLRLAVTNGQTLDDLRGVLAAYQHHLPLVLEEEGQTIDDISNNFNLPFEEAKKKFVITKADHVENLFDVQHETTIHKIDKVLWDELLGDNGTFDWEGCRFIEETFKDNPEPENNWQLHYVIIRETVSQKPVLATFFSVLLCKDDMISPESVSKQIEEIRKENRYYLTSKVVMMGSLLSLGEHLYLNRNTEHWKDAFLLLIKLMNEIKITTNSTSLLLRDFNTNDDEVKNFLIKEGFARSDMFNEHVISNLDWESDDDFLKTLSKKSRAHQNKYTIPNQDLFDVKIVKGIKQEELTERFSLYKQVKEKGFEMNTFDLPTRFFLELSTNNCWEVIELYLKGNPKILAFGICYNSPAGNYIPFVVGFDYGLNRPYGIYRQILLQAVKRANQLRCKNVFFGYGADIEKHKFGTTLVAKSVYFQSNDNFSLESMGTLQQVNYHV